MQAIHLYIREDVILHQHLVKRLFSSRLNVVEPVTGIVAAQVECHCLTVSATKPQSSSKFLHYFYHTYGKLLNMHDACIGKPIPSIQYMDAIRALFLVKSMKTTGLRNMCFKCKQLNWQKRGPSILPLNIQLYIWPNKKGLCIMKILIYNI